ncbi:hypothetical protein ABPG72_000871 [Tetrahymena utriculariae]
MATEQENDDLWDNLQLILSENPQGFFKILLTINEEQGLKMFKAINLINDEIVMIREMIIQKGQIEYIKRMNNSHYNKSKQQFEIKVFDKYLRKKTLDQALIWFELEYCQMGSIHELVQITKLAFSEGEIAFMVDQIMKYLQELQRDGLLKDQRPLLDSRHLFLTKQGVLKFFPFPLFSQLVKNENLVSEINSELIQLISFMDNNISGKEDNFSEGIKILVKALKEDQDYSQILKTKIIQENKDKFEYIKRSIYSTRKRAIENYRKTSMSNFVPDTLKNGQNDSQLNSQQQFNLNEGINQASQKKQTNFNANEYEETNSDGSPNIKDSRFQREKKVLQNNYRSNHMPHRKNQFSNQYQELSQDLKDISQINAFQNPYFSSLESNGSICQYLMNSQSIQSKNTNNCPSFLFQSGTGALDFYNLNELKNVTERRFEDEERENQKDIILYSNQLSDNQVASQKTDCEIIVNNNEKKGQQQQVSNIINIKQFLENHPEKKPKIKLFIKEKKYQDVVKENHQVNLEENNGKKNQINSESSQIKSDQIQQKCFSPSKNIGLSNQSFISPDRESNFSNESCKITARSERQFGQVQQELATEAEELIKIQNNDQAALNMLSDKLDGQQINEANTILEESSEIASSFPQSPYTNRKTSQNASDSQKKYSPKLEYVDLHQISLRAKINSSSDDKQNFQELDNKKFITLEPIQDQLLTHKMNHQENEAKILTSKSNFIQRVDNCRYEVQQNSESKQQCDTEQYNTNEVIVQDDNFESFDIRGDDDDDEDDDNDYDNLNEDYYYDKKLYEPVSSVIPHEYETFGGGSPTVAPTNEGTNAGLSERNGDCIEQKFQKIGEYQEQEFVVSCMPTSGCNHAVETKYQQNKNSLKFNQDYPNESQGFDNSQQQELSQSGSEEEEEIISIQSHLAEDWRMKKPYAFPSNGNMGIYVEKSQEKQRYQMKRSNSEHIDMFTLKDYMMQKRNSSPAGKQFKKTESPKVEMPSSVHSPESSASPSSSSKQERQPFQIRNLQQIICHSASSKNDSRKYAYRTNDGDDIDQESTTFHNPTDCNDTFQQMVSNEQNQRKQIELEDEDHLSNYQSKKRNLSTPFIKNQRKPIFSDIQTVNSRSQSRNYFYDSKEYDFIPSTSKQSDQKQINLSNQSYQVSNQYTKSKNSNAAVNYKNRKINEGSIDTSTNQSYCQTSSKLFPTQQSSEKDISFIKNNLFAQIENINCKKNPSQSQQKISQNFNVINQSMNICQDQNYSQISKQNSYLQLEQTPKQSSQKFTNQLSAKSNLVISSQENSGQQNQSQIASQQSNQYHCDGNYFQAQSCQNAFCQQIRFDHNQNSQISSAQNLDQNSILSPSNIIQDSNNFQNRQASLQKIQQQNQQFQLQQQQQQQLAQYSINQQNPLSSQNQYSYQNLQQQQLNSIQQPKLPMQLNQPSQQIYQNTIPNIHSLQNINTKFQDRTQCPQSQQQVKIQIQSSLVNQFNQPTFYNNQSNFQQVSDEKQQLSMLCNPLTPTNQIHYQQNNCFQQTIAQNTNRPTSSEKISLIAQKGGNSNHFIQMLFPNNIKKSILDSSLNEEIGKRKYGKDLTSKFNEEGEYMGGNNNQKIFEQGIKQLGPSQNMEVFDTLSTDESVQVKGVSLMRPGFILRNNQETQQQDSQQQQQLNSAKLQNQSNQVNNNKQTSYQLNQIQNKQNSQQNTQNNNNSNNQQNSRNIANKLFS